MSKHQESFPVLSISREDVTRAMGYDLGAKLSDNQMRLLASKLSDAISEMVSELGFWGVLANVLVSTHLDKKVDTPNENDKGE